MSNDEYTTFLTSLQIERFVPKLSFHTELSAASPALLNRRQLVNRLVGNELSRPIIMLLIWVARSSAHACLAEYFGRLTDASLNRQQRAAV